MIGKNIPYIEFMTRVRDDSIDGPNPFRWEVASTDQLFGDKRVLVFSLPGAFTPTCSTYQLPGFEDNYNRFKSAGIDEIYCVSVNDAFVMNKWAKDQCIERVKVIPDGNGELTEALDMLVNKKHLGFGYRSWRYAFVAEDTMITDWYEEPGKNQLGDDDDPYGETSPETIYKDLTGESISDE
jgi:peroxiredoxin